MDAIAGLLDGPRARDAFLLRSVLQRPWSMRVQDRAPLTLLAVVRGAAWVISDTGTAVHLQAGDVAVLRGPDPYVVADDPATPTQVLIGADQRCTPLTETGRMTDLGVRTWGNHASGTDVLLTGTYQLRSAVSRRLLGALPATLVLPASDRRDPLVGYLAEEVVQDGPGQEAVLDRLLDLLLIATLRTWFSRPEANPPGCYAASGDPVVGPALRLIHLEPARPWSVTALAAACGVSRAAFARRFHDLVGEPPMAYLTGWRLTLAADLLREPDATVAAVAQQVGYGSPYALSAAFKRTRGVSPQEHRRAGPPSLPGAEAAADPAGVPERRTRRHRPPHPARPG